VQDVTVNGKLPAMADPAPAEPAADAPPSPERLHAAMREARDDAAPFALAAAIALVLLSVISVHAGWKLLGLQLWWLWLVIAIPYICLSAVLVLGLGRLVRHDRRREIVIALLAFVWFFNVAGVVVLVASLLAQSGSHVTGRQLLLSGGVVWFTDVIAFGLAYW
jgi:hypothetical protein